MPRSDRSSFPVRGVPGGWRDPWDQADDDDAIRRRNAAFDAVVQRVGAIWQAEIAAEKDVAKRRRSARLGGRNRVDLYPGGKG